MVSDTKPKEKKKMEMTEIDKTYNRKKKKGAITNTAVDKGTSKVQEEGRKWKAMND